MLLGVLLLAQLCEGSCCTRQVELARNALAVYVDPTTEKREAVLTGLRASTFRSDSGSDHDDAVNRYACDSYLRDALDAIERMPDPRTWDPSWVASMVVEARREEALVDWKQTWPPQDPHENRLEDIYRDLMPMGATRVIALISPHKVVPNPEPTPKSGIMPGVHGEHFADELLLYADEWARSLPDIPAIVSMRGVEKQKRVQQMQLYVQKRWRETDDAAPHPDLDAVRAAIEKLEAPEPKK
jgi:hypothetical protein